MEDSIRNSLRTQKGDIKEINTGREIKGHEERLRGSNISLPGVAEEKNSRETGGTISEQVTVATFPKEKTKMSFQFYNFIFLNPTYF